MHSFIAYLNLAISLFGLWATVSRIGDALHFLNKFAGYDNSSGVTIGAYITLMALNVIIAGSLTSPGKTEPFMRQRWRHISLL